MQAVLFSHTLRISFGVYFVKQKYLKLQKKTT